MSIRRIDLLGTYYASNVRNLLQGRFIKYYMVPTGGLRTLSLFEIFMMVLEMARGRGGVKLPPALAG